MAQQYDVVDPLGLDLFEGAAQGLFDTVETGVGIGARDGGHLRQRDAEQGEGHVVDDALVPGAACVKQLRQSLQPQRGIGGLLTVVDVGGEHREIELAQKLHQRPVAQIEFVVADHHGIRSQEGQQVRIGPPFEAIEVK